MISLHQGHTGELLGNLIGPADQPIILITPILPAHHVLDQIVISSRQVARELRVLTSLYGQGPVSTKRQIDGLLKLKSMGVKLKTAGRGTLPSLLASPPDGCLLLPTEWGLTSERWKCPVIIPGDQAGELFSHAEKIWLGSGSAASRRNLLTTKRWLDEITDDSGTGGGQGDEGSGEIEFSDLTLFDKRRGGGRKKKKPQNKAWWTFHGTADDRANLFLPIRSWARQRSTHKVIRFPVGRRPTGVKTGDVIFFVVHSRLPDGKHESFIVGKGIAVAYRPLIDDATDDERAVDEYLARFPHAVRLASVRFIRGAVGEGIPAHKLMSRLGASTFESTLKNVSKGRGNTDPFKSINQKSILQLSDKCTGETNRKLEERLNVLGSITAAEISSNR